LASQIFGATHRDPPRPTQRKRPAGTSRDGWSRSVLAGYVGVSDTTVWAFESGKRRSSALNLDLVRAAFESAGVIFVEENGERPGVRLSKQPS
jgi:transcriptional regulator with XRE-family HTH domain